MTDKKARKSEITHDKISPLVLKDGFFKFSQEVIRNSKYPSNVKEITNAKNRPDETNLYNFLTIFDLTS